jgi:hypothetical protein
VSWNKINATLPKGVAPAEIQALGAGEAGDPGATKALDWLAEKHRCCRQTGGKDRDQNHKD